MQLNRNLEERYLLAAEMMIDNEDFQNFQINPLLKDLVMAGVACDYLNPDMETFGVSPNNPVPVNGPYGELTYLARLRTPDGQGFLYHRLGSINAVDEYEIISFDGKTRAFLYFDMYHPRRSRLPVKGFLLEESPQAWTGFSHRVPDFPYSFMYHFDGAEEMALFMPNREELWEIVESIGEDDRRMCPRRTPDIMDFAIQWRANVTEGEIEQANELHGFIIKTDGEFSVDGVRFGWYPSKALAKRRGLDPYLMYDPAVIVLLEGFDAYMELSGELGALCEISMTPKQLRFDKNGFFSTLEFQTLGQLDDFVDFLSSYYLPKRTYQIAVEYARIGHSPIFYVRWFSDVIGTYEVRECYPQPEKESKLIGTFNAVGNLTLSF